ncbi:F174 protein, partial [Polyodon spathula]|nr:F174 protein [Polyodon spathula]
MVSDKTRICNTCLFVYMLVPLLFPGAAGEANKSTSTTQQQGNNKSTNDLSNNNTTILNAQTGSVGVISDKHNSKKTGTGSSSVEGVAETAAANTRPLSIQRALYVLMAVSAVVIVYFVIRTVRMRKKSRKTRRYGVLDTNLAMEMTPLEQDDDDEEDDTTLFDARLSRRFV